jgi:hypothetical protein
MPGVRRQARRRPQEVVPGFLFRLVRGRRCWSPHAPRGRLSLLVERDQDIQPSGAWRGHWEGGRGLGISLVRRANGRAIVTQKTSVSRCHRDAVRRCHHRYVTMSYRRYILPLLPTFATVKGLPSLPAALPSTGGSYLESPSFALCFELFSLRNPSCKGRRRALSALPIIPPLNLGEGASAGFFSGESPISRAATMRLELANPRRGDRRSRCRRRMLSGDRAITAGGLGATSMGTGGLEGRRELVRLQRHGRGLPTMHWRGGRGDRECWRGRG